MKKLDEEDLKLSLIEDINDVTKQKDMGSFYRHLYKSELCKNEINDKMNEVKKPYKKSDANRHYRKRESSNSSTDRADDDDNDTDISDNSASSENSLKRRKLENHKKTSDRKLLEKSAEIELEGKPLLIENTQENIQNESPNNEKELEKIVKDTSINKTKEIKDGTSTAKVPKINIWEKRTVGDIYKTARQRYFERKMKTINLDNRL